MKVLKAFLNDLDDLDREHKHSEPVGLSLYVTLCNSPIFMTHQDKDILIPLPENVIRYGQK